MWFYTVFVFGGIGDPGSPDWEREFSQIIIYGDRCSVRLYKCGEYECLSNSDCACVQVFFLYFFLFRLKMSSYIRRLFFPNV